MGDAKFTPAARAYNPTIDGIVEARGRKLEIGDEIMLNIAGPIYFRVINIRPALHPKIPPGMLQIEIAAAVHFYAPRGMPQREFIRVRTAEEAGELPIKLADDIEPPTDDPGGPSPDEPKVVLP